MNASYGVVWRRGAKDLATGKLELLPRALRLEGMSGSHPATCEIPYESLGVVRVGREPSDRIHGRPSLVIERRHGEPVAISSVSQEGVIGELAQRLAALRPGRRTTVVLPLQPGSVPAVRELLAAGPPFDPDQLELARHEVFLTPDEAIFVFESRQGAGPLEQLLAEPNLWQGAAAWAPYIAGPPRIAEDAYSWADPSPAIDPSLLPPGLRNGNGATGA
jgi:hypothetical protein